MKAIFVDGASLFCMGEVVGLRRVSFLALYNLLVRELGTEKRLADIPLMVIGPDKASAFAKPLAGAGFDVVAATTSDGSDDRVIIERIRQLDVDRVTELVIVSNDRDYMPVVKFKIMQGLGSVYWVGTKKADSHNRYSLGRDLSNLLTQPGFTFVDIENHRERLAYIEHWQNATPDAPAVPATPS